MFANYLDAREYLERAAGMSEGLERIEALLNLLDRPDSRYKIIHVAGTNGKGSVTHYVATALSACGYCVGRYSSPAVFDELETVAVNSAPWVESEFMEALDMVVTAANQVHPTPTRFELETAAALVHFAKRKCDFVVLETGLGGRLDATNAVRGTLVSALTSIGLDHTAILGDTLSAIAGEKSGIIKTGAKVVSAPCEEEVRAVLERVAHEVGVPLRYSTQGTLISHCTSGQVIRYLGRDYTTRMLGVAQRVNLPLALGILEQVRACGYFVSPESVADGIARAKLPGRFEIISTNPTIILDGAHNPSAAKMLSSTLEHYAPNDKFIFVVGCFADKDTLGIVRNIAEKASHIFTFQWENLRAEKSACMAQLFKTIHSNVTDAHDLIHALKGAYQVACAEKKTIIIFGSLSHLKLARTVMEECKK